MEETVLVQPNSLVENAEKLKSESIEKMAQQPPTKSGSGYMANKLDEIVQNVKDLYANVIELINTSASMLEKMGVEFAEMDEVTAEVYKNIR